MLLHSNFNTGARAMPRRSDAKLPAREVHSTTEEAYVTEANGKAIRNMKPAVILVGADKGGVGKTTVARALADYLVAKNVPTRAFDTETPKGTLKRFHSDMTEVVDISSTSDQMKILDTLNTTQVKVSLIDARAGSFATSLKALRNMGFFEAVREGQFTFIMFHVLGPSIASLSEIAETAPYAPDAHYFLVKNHVNDTTFFEWDPTTYSTYFSKTRSAGEVAIPKLSEMAYEQVDIAAAPFSSFVANKHGDGRSAMNSFVLRGYVRTWQRKVNEEFDRIGLLDLINIDPATS
jgi:hypothetical protein